MAPERALLARSRKLSWLSTPMLGSIGPLKLLGAQIELAQVGGRLVGAVGQAAVQAVAAQLHDL